QRAVPDWGWSSAFETWVTAVSIQRKDVLLPYSTTDAEWRFYSTPAPTRSGSLAGSCSAVLFLVVQDVRMLCREAPRLIRPQPLLNCVATDIGTQAGGFCAIEPGHRCLLSALRLTRRRIGAAEGY